MKDSMAMFLKIGVSMGLVLLLLVFVAPGSTLAASTQTVAAGPYALDVSLSQDPPFVDQPFDVIVSPHDGPLQLKGEVITSPGLGTNGVDLHTPLSSMGDGKGTLKGSVHIPVQGAWNIVIQVKGGKGVGRASIPVTVGAPGAMAPWLAWLIGSSPLVLIAIFVWLQHRYKQRLIVQPQ